MKKLLLAIAALVMCSAGVLAAAIDTPVTITGCVHAGTEPDTFVLLNVDELTDGKAAPAGAVYWLSSTKGLKDQVGRRVEVVGTYSLDRDFGKTAKLKIKSDATSGQETVALENGAKKAEIKEELKPVGTTGVVSSEVKRPYRRLEVKTITPTAERCVAP